MGLLWALYTYFAYPVLTLLFYVMIAWVVVSWLISFGILNLNNPNARMIVGFINRICEPMCAPIRRILPSLGGLDLSPLIVLLGIGFIRDWLLPTIIRSVSGVPVL